MGTSIKKSLIEKLKQYPVLAGTAKKEMLEDILLHANADMRIYEEINGENQRASLRFLVDLCKKKKHREVITPLVIRDVDMLLTIEDNKARKVSCMLIGICAPNECAKKLLDVLKTEKTRFVKPSIILALGNSDNPELYLKNYVVEPGEVKHVEAETAAIRKALAKSLLKPKDVKIKLPEMVIVTSLKLSALISELNDKKIAYSRVGHNGLNIKSINLSKIRCYDEALYYIGTTQDLQRAADVLDSFGCAGLVYRIEAGKLPIAKRSNTIKNISHGMFAYGYTDNPSSYSFEIRPMPDNKLFAVFKEKSRFTYRVATISASINPVTAASVMQICKPYMKPNADVLDPFCGSGTMLIERGIIKPVKSLVGVDISEAAIDAAHLNSKASDQQISLFRSDIMNFSITKYDEIVSNMPFRNRVSDFESDIRLYNLFAKRLGMLLKQNGVAFIYTQEKKLFRNEIMRNDLLRIIKEEIFDSGGIYPTLFIIERK